ncbi:MAG: Flp pilus assembly complex ATPase component TadA [Burkholderiales bacterium]|nr:Flp pilus assembly complex ATPase component TadA [Burkholderiales bacterium]MDE2565454.1 Flp pilus assembly complex ATPase component TadA [Burkholderiales bacterium]
MSDLSQPVLAVLPEEAAGYAWPTPDLAGYPAPGPLGGQPACRIEGLNGRAIEGRLLRFDPVPGLLQVRSAGVARPVSLRFEQFRRLCLLDPVPALEAPADARDLASERPQMPFRVEFGNGNLWEGRTLGQREEAWGLFLFEPLDERGTVRRWFVPRAAYVEAEVGLRIGEALIAQRSTTPEQIAAALAEQQTLRTRKLGDLLLERHIITADELAAAIEHQARMPMVRIGEALTGLGLISPAQLQQALDSQRQDRGVPLGELLVRSGAVTRADLQTALARKMGYPLVDVLQFPADAEAVARLPYAVAARVPALPLLLRGGRLVVAVEDPSNRARLDELEFAAQCKVVPVLVRTGVLQAAVDRAYEKFGAYDFSPRLPGDPAAPIEFEPGDASKLLASMESGADPRAEEDLGAVIEQSDNTLVRLINSMIVEAHTQGVSDIHIECTGGREKVRIRFRKDGQLRPYLELPPGYRSAIIARLKIMCDLDISERRKPQDGKINFAKFVQGVRLELRVATIPTQNNLEDAVLRLLASNKPLPLEQLGLAPAILERLREAARRPHGMLLCVGPTGSGKTTTLHSVLGSINTAERKIWTAEDPIEITQPGLRQVQVNPRIDWTFAKALRAFLRADPDVIMVGEIRDPETAQVAIEASLTGHLVLSTLHTNSAPETVTRLLDMGMDPFNFADALLGVLAQRLVRRLCLHCRTEAALSPAEEDELLQDHLHAMAGAEQRPEPEAVRADWRARWGRDVAADGMRSGPLTRYRCAGCEQCSGSGYRGRAGIHELMTVSRGLRHLIQTNSRADDLQRHALGEGLRTLRQDGIEKVLAGVTSIEEVRANS